MVTLIFLLYSLTFAVHADEGPIIDPNGGRPVAVHSDEGSGMCPVGRMSGGAYSDSRGAFDPNG